jgi:hypothetical protein
MNFPQAFVKLEIAEDSNMQIESKPPVVYVCSMCEQKANSVEDLKLHLTKAHVEPEVEPEVKPEAIQKKESFLIDKRIVGGEIKVKEERIDNYSEA